MTRPSLADHPDLHIGNVTLRPSTGELIGASGRDAVEPRVMEVLLALVAARGAVLSRDALVETCWEGRAVSEDAITRVISRIRRLSKGVAAGSFSIETLPKIGYRLQVAPTDPQQAAQDKLEAAKRSARTVTRPAWIALVALLIVIAVGSGVIWLIRIEEQAADPARRAPAQAAAEFASGDLEVRGRAAVFEGTPSQLGRGIAYLREATVRTPADAHAWGALAMAQVLSLRTSSPEERTGVTLRIREAATRALSLDPHEGLALAAQISLEPSFGAWSRKDAALAHAARLAPANTPALLVQRAHFLAAVGRTREATALMEQASAAAPLLPWIQADLVQLLMDGQRLDEADRVASRALALWPRDPQLWRARFWLYLVAGRIGDAVAMTTDRSRWPEGVSSEDMERDVQTALAARERSKASADIALAAWRRAVQQGTPEADGQSIRAALVLDRPQSALDIAEGLFMRPATAAGAIVGPQRPGEPDTAPLFSASARPLWTMPRFAGLVNTMGLAGFWKATRPPDLCRVVAVQSACGSADASPPAP